MKLNEISAKMMESMQALENEMQELKLVNKEQLESLNAAEDTKGNEIVSKVT
jgi:hypothetical protein